MADRASDLISLGMIPENFTQITHPDEIGHKENGPEEEIVQSLQMDLITGKNIIFYAPSPKSNLILSFQAALSAAVHNELQIVCILHNNPTKMELMDLIAKSWDKSVTALKIGDFRDIHSIIDSEGKKKRENIKKSEDNLPAENLHNDIWDNDNVGVEIRYTNLEKIRKKIKAARHQVSINEILSNLTPQCNVIFLKYSDLFTFHPHQPGFYQIFSFISRNILIFEDSHYLPQFLLDKYSIAIPIDYILKLQTYISELFKSNPENLIYRFTGKFLKLFCNYLTSNFDYSPNIPIKEHRQIVKKEYPFRPLEFLLELCKAHSCSFEKLQTVFQSNFMEILSDPLIKNNKTHSKTSVKIFNYFTAVFHQRSNPSLPFTFSYELNAQGNSLFMTLLDIRHFTNPIFENAAATLSVSPSLDIRSFLGITGLGSLTKPFIIRHLPTSIISHRVTVWGELSINPQSNFKSPVFAAKYASKIIEHAKVLQRNNLILFGNTSLFQGVLSAGLVKGLEDVGYAVLICSDSSDLHTRPAKTFLSCLKHDKHPSGTEQEIDKPHILIMDLSKIPLEFIQPLQYYFEIFSFVSIPSETSSYRLEQRKKYLSRKYDLNIARIYTQNYNFYKIHALTAYAPFNKTGKSIIIFYDGSILEYQKYLLPWVYERITFIPPTSQALAQEINTFFK